MLAYIDEDFEYRLRQGEKPKTVRKAVEKDALTFGWYICESYEEAMRYFLSESISVGTVGLDNIKWNANGDTGTAKRYIYDITNKRFIAFDVTLSCVVQLSE